MSDSLAWTVRALLGQVQVPDLANLPRRVHKKK